MAAARYNTTKPSHETTPLASNTTQCNASQPSVDGPRDRKPLPFERTGCGLAHTGCLHTKLSGPEAPQLDTAICNRAYAAGHTQVNSAISAVSADVDCATSTGTSDINLVTAQSGVS